MPPVTQKIIVAAAVFLLALGCLGAAIYAKTGENAELETQIEAIKGEVTTMNGIIDTKKVKLDLRKQQEESFADLVKILPLQSEINDEAILNSITAYASVAKLHFKGETPLLQKGAKAAGDFQQTELQLEFEGPFFNFLRFLNSVESNESFLRVDAFSLVPAPESAAAKKEREKESAGEPKDRDLKISVRISTFSYLPK